MEVNQKEFNFIDTEATRKIFQLKKRIRAVCGGTSASKTISILVWIIDYCQSNKNKKFDVMSESYPHLEDGAIKDFKALMIDRRYWRDDAWNESKHAYHFETGSVLKFISVDKLGKAHGPRRDGLFINEANNIDYHIYDQLEVRTNEVIWLDWNPSVEFWYYTEIQNNVDHDFLTLTYLDCLNALNPNIIQSIESKKHRKGWWQVYGLGQLGEVEGKIYKDWQIIDEVPHEARLIRRGLDFGYSIDPTVLEDLYYYNGGFIIDEQLYQKGLSNRAIADLILNLVSPQTLVIADSAEPKSIDEIKDYGVNIMGASKGPGSVGQGIQYVQDQRISVTRRSIKTIKAYRNYLFFVDRDGKVTNEPDDSVHEWSNPMDSLRYAIVSTSKGSLQTEEQKNKEAKLATLAYMGKGLNNPWQKNEIGMKPDEYLQLQQSVNQYINTP
jgi:phage terminase large subunit